jgi:hypothetical protein
MSNFEGIEQKNFFFQKWFLNISNSFEFSKVVVVLANR